MNPNPENVATVLNGLLLDSFTLKECRKSAEAQAASEASDVRKAGDRVKPEDIEIRTDFLAGAHLMRRAHRMASGMEAFQREFAEKLRAQAEAEAKKASEAAAGADQVPPLIAAPPVEEPAT